MARTIAVDLVGRDMLSRSLATAAESTRVLKRSLDELSRRVSIQVDADTGRARSELGATRSEVTRLDGRRANISANADVGAAMAALQGLGMALGGLAAIPVGATVGAGVMALVPSFAAAGIGAAGLAAVAVPAISDIKAALQAQTQAQGQSGAAAVASQSRQLALAGAQQQVASAVRQAAQAHAQALQQVQQAEQQRTQAVQSAITAERDLVTARRDAAKQLQDLSNSAADARLSERQAAFDAADAQANYNKVAADPKSTQDQIARAQLALEQAKQNQNERHLATQRAIADERAGAKAGVEGSDTVRNARQRLAAANQQVANAERSLSQARAGVARADQQSADAVASARRGLTAASLQGAGASSALDAAMAKLSPSARNLMGHWTGLKDAFDSWRKSMEPTVLPIFGRALDMLKGQIPSLTPIVKGAAGAVNGLVTDIGKNAKSPFWAQFRDSLTKLVPTAITGFGKTAGNVATGLAGIINAFIPYAPSLLDWIVKISGKFATWGKGLGGSNQVSKFMDYVKENGPKVWEIVQNLATAAAHVVTALSGAGGSSLDGFVNVSKALAGMSPGQIQALAAAFVGFKAASAGVQGAKVLGDIPDKIKEAHDQITGLADSAKSAWSGISTGAKGTASAFGRIRDGFRSTQAAESAFSGRMGSFGGVLRKGLDAGKSGWSSLVSGAKGAGTAVAGVSVKIAAAGKAAALASLDMLKLAGSYVLTGLKAAWSAIQLIAVKVAQLAVKAATAAWAAIQWALDAAMNANPIGLIVIAIAALVAGVIYAYTHFKWFKTAVDAAWKGIVAAAKWAWNNILKPIFGAIVWYITNVLVPGYKMLWNWVKVIWNGIGSAISWVWNHGIKPVFGAIKTAVGAVKTAFQIAVDAIKKIWDGLRSATRGPVAFVVNTIYNGGIRKVWEGVRKLVPALPALPTVKFADGGVLGGYAPGKDSVLAMLSPGEGILRPEAVRALGEDFIHKANSAAKTGGASGVAKVLGGYGDPGGIGLPGFADGGIVGILKNPLNAIKGAGSSIMTKGVDVFAHRILDPIMARVGGGGPGLWAQALAGLPKRMIDGFLSFIKRVVSPNLAGRGSHAAVQAARSQIGLPYAWGGGGLGGPSRGFAQGAPYVGFDCSSLMEYAWGKASGGKDISRTTYSQKQVLRPISHPVEGAVGQPHSGHTYMYSGNGHVVEAPHTGANIRETTARGGEWWGMPPWTADTGGWLKANSVTAIHNGSNKPEALVPSDLMPSGGGPVVLEIRSGGSKMDDLLVEVIRKSVRDRGGNVQVALGQR